MISATISSEFEQFIYDEVAAGKYGSADEVVSAGLRLLCEREAEALRGKLDIGLEQIERGDVIDVDNENAHRVLFDDIKTRGRQRLSTGRSAQ